MRLSIAALLLLLASCLSPGHGILEANYTTLKCRCSGMVSGVIHPSFIEQIQVRYRGNGCPKDEVLISTKNKKIVCVNPQAKWLQIVLKLLRSKTMSSTVTAPVSKRRTTST
ncbi:C-X-C motif chemokine 13 isoform X1 [Mesocricetus auratus]|uniref:C-X-C motif chemokine n=1 Tax=Mesocricetus auratus TaxID=10036 RepID=Q91ZF6_MESAU|nr:C-X-C motif chemokine 13 precursor [Mesocricetus auratus]XP_040602498.1 C-X-C motif chemokine 13 isoform X1 [Mesocricetus auratus]AAG16634.1 B lymphocyte chemoattractant [Mesocricetus auratus]